jgi:Flp pilus assembly pilin Flp
MGRVRRRSDDGAATLEYSGILFVVAAVVLALVASVTPVGDALLARICAALDAQCGTAAVDQRAKDLKIPCVFNQTDRSLGYNVNIEFVRGERKDTDQIKTNADGSASVTLTQGGGLGLEAAKSTAGQGLEGKARITGNGDLGYVYNFPNAYGGHDAAQSFLDDRRGGLDQAVDIVVPGAQTIREGANQAGNAVSDGWDWATGKLGFGPSAQEKAAKERAQAAGTPDAVQVSLSLQGAAGVTANGGLVKGGVDAGDLQLSTTTLDLSVAENRAAFDQVFTVYGVDAGEVHAKVADIRLDGGLPGLVTAWSGLQQRLDADGFEATYQYETTGDSLSATGGEKAAKAGGWGVGGEKTDSGRQLVGAVARDNRLGGVDLPLATCGK